MLGLTAKLPSNLDRNVLIPFPLSSPQKSHLFNRCDQYPSAEIASLPCFWVQLMHFLLPTDLFPFTESWPIRYIFSFLFIFSSFSFCVWACCVLLCLFSLQRLWRWMGIILHLDLCGSSLVRVLIFISYFFPFWWVMWGEVSCMMFCLVPKEVWERKGKKSWNF